MTLWYVMTKPFYSIKEFAELLNLHPRTIYRAIKGGKVSAFRLSNNRRSEYRIAASEIERLSKINLEEVVESIVKIRLNEGKKNV